MFSIWEKQSYLKNDVIIVGGGIVGLSVGCSILEKNSDKKVLILERGVLPTGASTKNAGFICTDSLTEFIEDIKKMGEKEAINLFNQRYQGYNHLIQRLGRDGCDAKFQGSYELIDKDDFDVSQIDYANNLLRDIYKKDIFTLRNDLISQFGFNQNKVKMMIESSIEGQIDTGLAMRNLYKRFVSIGGLYLTGAEVKDFKKIDNNSIQVNVKNTSESVEDLVFDCQNLVFCTNGFTNNLIKPELDLAPGRGQVIVTKPIKNLKFKGIFHMDEGFYYFRDYYGRVIFGGGRNTDFIGETTTKIETTPKIINHLKTILKEVLLPNTDFEIDYEWSGIMCFSKDGKGKTPIVQQLQKNIFVAARMVGQGVALSSNVGEQIEKMIYPKIKL
ncbi:hypothetical protein ABPG74_012918 [Tetrahymena malaccensis]